jgi:hypothetical protein
MIALRPRPLYARWPVYISHIKMPKEKESTAVVSFVPYCGREEDTRAGRQAHERKHCKRHKLDVQDKKVQTQTSFLCYA